MKISKLTIINQLYIFIIISAIFAFIFEILLDVSNITKISITVLLYTIFIAYLNYQISIIKNVFIYLSIILFLILFFLCVFFGLNSNIVKFAFNFVLIGSFLVAKYLTNIEI
jgi:hypothetical protein